MSVWASSKLCSQAEAARRERDEDLLKQARATRQRNIAAWEKQGLIVPEEVRDQRVIEEVRAILSGKGPQRPPCGGRNLREAILAVIEVYGPSTLTYLRATLPYNATNIATHAQILARQGLLVREQRHQQITARNSSRNHHTHTRLVRISVYRLPKAA